MPLAPLHNPAVIEGIRAAQSLLGNVFHVAIFDTAFFTQLPEEAYTYAINRDLAKRNAIRKYGFHGTSHQYVSQQVPAVVGTDLGEPQPDRLPPGQRCVHQRHQGWQAD